MRWSLLAPGARFTSYVRSNVFGAVVEARRSPAEKPSGETRSAYASTLLPVLAVAPGGSQGSFVEMGPFWIVSRFGVWNVGAKKSGSPVGCGVGPVHCAPSSRKPTAVVCGHT